MRWQIGRKIVAVQLDVHEMHGQGELVGVQHAVFVDVGKFPNFSQNVVRKFGLDHLLLRS